MMRFSAPLLALCALTLAACGGGSPALPAGDAVIEASFGSPTPGQALTGNETWDITVFNFSNALILDMGLRPFGTSNAYTGGLSGHNPATFGAGANGGAYWTTVPRGGYEIFIETDKGRVEVLGYTPTVTLPDGSFAPAPAHIYIWGSDFVGQIPDPVSRVRNPVTPIPVN